MYDMQKVDGKKKHSKDIITTRRERRETIDFIEFLLLLLFSKKRKRSFHRLLRLLLPLLLSWEEIEENKILKFKTTILCVVAWS
jgi:hypothetical protein